MKLCKGRRNDVVVFVKASTINTTCDYSSSVNVTRERGRSRIFFVLYVECVDFLHDCPALQRGRGKETARRLTHRKEYTMPPSTTYRVQNCFFFGEEWFRLAPFSQLSLAVTSRHKILFSSQILHSVYFCLV